MNILLLKVIDMRIYAKINSSERAGSDAQNNFDNDDNDDEDIENG